MKRVVILALALSCHGASAAWSTWDGSAINTNSVAAILGDLYTGIQERAEATLGDWGFYGYTPFGMETDVPGRTNDMAQIRPIRIAVTNGMPVYTNIVVLGTDCFLPLTHAGTFEGTDWAVTSMPRLARCAVWSRGEFIESSDMLSRLDSALRALSACYVRTQALTSGQTIGDWMDAHTNTPPPCWTWPEVMGAAGITSDWPEVSYTVTTNALAERFRVADLLRCLVVSGGGWTVPAWDAWHDAAWVGGSYESDWATAKAALSWGMEWLGFASPGQWTAGRYDALTLRYSAEAHTAISNVTTLVDCTVQIPMQRDLWAWSSTDGATGSVYDANGTGLLSNRWARFSLSATQTVFAIVTDGSIGPWCDAPIEGVDAWRGWALGGSAIEVRWPTFEHSCSP